MSEQYEFYSSAMDRRLHAEEPHVVLGIPPRRYSQPVDSYSRAVDKNVRSLMMGIHPDLEGSPAAQKDTTQTKRVLEAARSLEDPALSGNTSALIFGAQSSGTRAMRVVSQELAEAYIYSTMLGGKTVKCNDCNGRGLQSSIMDNYTMPVLTTCTCCGGEGAITLHTHRIREATEQLVSYEPRWFADPEYCLNPNKEPAIGFGVTESFEEVIKRYILEDPVLRTRPYITTMISKITTLANLGINYKQSFLSGNKTLSDEAAVRAVISCISLGVGALESEDPAALRRLIVEQKWGEILKKGRKLNKETETQEQSIAAGNVVKDFGPNNQIVLSGYVEQGFVDEHETNGIRKSYRDHYYRQVELQRMREILHFSETIGVTPEVCRRAIAETPALCTYIKKDQNSIQQLGLTELAVFVRALAQVSGREPEDFFTLPEECFECFAALYRVDGTQISLQHKHIAGILDAAKEAFPEHAEIAKLLCHNAICNIPFVLKERRLAALPIHLQKGRDRSVEETLRNGFPSIQSMKRFLQELQIVSQFESHVETFAEESVEPVEVPETLTKSFPSPTEVFSMDSTQLFDLMNQYPSALSWHSVLCNQTPERVSALLHKLFSILRVEAQSFACNLFLLLFSLEDECSEGSMHIAELLQENSEVFSALNQRRSTSTECLLGLEDRSIRQLMTYTRLLDHSGFGNLKKLLILLDEQTDVSPQDNLRYWHPHFATPINPDELLQDAIIAVNSGANIQVAVQKIAGLKEMHSINMFTATLIETLDAAGEDDIDAFLEAIPRFMVGDVCRRVLCIQLQSYTAISEIEEDVHREAGEEPPKESILAGPTTLFLRADGDLATYPAHWRAANILVEAIQRKPSIKQQVLTCLHHIKGKIESVMTLYNPLHKTSYVCKVLSSSKFSEEDLPVLKKLTEDPHPFLPRIVEKLHRSTRAMQTAILTECLSEQDAAYATLCLLQDYANESEVSVQDCITNITSPNIPRKIGFIEPIFAQNHGLLQKVQELLASFESDTPASEAIQSLTAHLGVPKELEFEVELP